MKDYIDLVFDIFITFLLGALFYISWNEFGSNQFGLKNVSFGACIALFFLVGLIWRLVNNRITEHQINKFKMSQLRK